MLSIIDLKKKLMRSHEQHSPRALGSEYETGFLAALETVLFEIDRSIEEEADRQARYYDEK